MLVSSSHRFLHRHSWCGKERWQLASPARTLQTTRKQTHKQTRSCTLSTTSSTCCCSSCMTFITLAGSLLWNGALRFLVFPQICQFSLWQTEPYAPHVMLVPLFVTRNNIRSPVVFPAPPITSLTLSPLYAIRWQKQKHPINCFVLLINSFIHIKWETSIWLHP